jgi:DNA-binding NarL/FixJ family response regulator
VKVKLESTIRVVLADDHQIVREGVRALLEASGLEDGRKLSVVGEAANATEAFLLCKQLSPDVAVLDVSLPGASGFDIAEQVRALPKAPKIVMLSMHVSPEHVRRARDVGAAAYVIKGSGVAELAEAIARVADGGTGPFPEVEPSGPRLTDREREVLTAVAGGKSNKEIAQQLGISVHTVNTHRVHLMEKLDVHDVASLTKIAMDLGLTG